MPTRREIWRTFPARSRRQATGVLVGNFQSQIGNSLHILAAAVISLKVTGSAASAVGVVVVSALPPLLLVRYVSTAVRTVSCAVLLVGIELVSAALVFIVPVASVLTDVALWHLYLQEFLLAVVAAFYGPALREWTTTASGDETRLQWLNSTLASTGQLAALLGWSLGGAVSAVFSPVFLMTVNGVTFLCSAVILGYAFRLDAGGRPWRFRTTDTGTRPVAATAGVSPEHRSVRQLLRLLFDTRTLGLLSLALLSLMLAKRLAFSMFVPLLAGPDGATPSVAGFANGAFSACAVVSGVLVAGGRIGALVAERAALFVALMFGVQLVFASTRDPVAQVLLYGVVGLLSGSSSVFQSLVQERWRDIGAGSAYAAFAAVQAPVALLASGLLALVLTVADVSVVYLVVVGGLGLGAALWGHVGLNREAVTQSV